MKVGLLVQRRVWCGSEGVKQELHSCLPYLRPQEMK